MNQFTLAETTQKKMSMIDDEDLATHLAHIFLLVTFMSFFFYIMYFKVFQGRLEDALFLIEETKEKFQDSLKLLNLKASCLIALKQYDNAKTLLEKLLNILTNKEQYKDKQETEICLNNLIVLSLVQGTSYDEYIK